MSLSDLVESVNQNLSHAIDHATVDGLGREHREELGRLQAVPLANGIETGVAQASLDSAPKQVGGDGHPGILDRFSQECQDPTKTPAKSPEKPDKFDAWFRWVDSKRSALKIAEGEAYDLESLTAPECTGASAVDTMFAFEMCGEMEDDPATANAYRQEGGEALARWERHMARRPKLTDAEMRDLGAYLSTRLDADFGSHVQIIRDSGAPLFTGAASTYLADYRKNLPVGWKDGVVVVLQPGKEPRICRWSDERTKIDETKQWCNDTRFSAVESVAFDDDTRRVLIPAPAPARNITIETLTAPTPAAAAPVYYPSGIPPLDALLRTRGIPRGARVVVQGTTAQGKTLFLLEVAEHLASLGLLVMWVATGDDPADQITARRLQRLGVSQGAEPPPGTPPLAKGLIVVDGREHTLEEILACEGIDVLILDPISKIRTARDVTDPVVKIGNVLDLVEQSGITTWMSSPTVRAASRRAAMERAYGGQRVESGATLLLELSRTDLDLSVSVIKSRLGGEGQALALRVDTDRQRVSAPTGGAALSVEDRIWRDVQAMLTTDGPQSAKALAERKVRGSAPLIRSVIRSRLEAGDLQELDGKLALP